LKKLQTESFDSERSKATIALLVEAINFQTFTVVARQDMYQKTRFAISSSVLIAGTSLRVRYELILTSNLQDKFQSFSVAFC
jgi:hypothetical protein